ncbi:hypothetical protein F511_33417 [Dorcoceras hygrometricum]|uniref:Uncharacterized protein n=1 Tax=Dorcoceras hygrometricum TaxID=472368 RepID=A0A2Z7C1B6_9LAMI|nr:hypothetical protein F511_33417 [Dorcoceras hygrometricum]
MCNLRAACKGAGNLDQLAELLVQIHGELVSQEFDQLLILRASGNTALSSPCWYLLAIMRRVVNYHSSWFGQQQVELLMHLVSQVLQLAVVLTQLEVPQECLRREMPPRRRGRCRGQFQDVSRGILYLPICVGFAIDIEEGLRSRRSRARPQGAQGGRPVVHGAQSS